MPLLPILDSDINITQLGLKGANLFRLIHDGFNVPFTMVYPSINTYFCSSVGEAFGFYNKEKESVVKYIELPNIPLPDTFAVRSSGSVSMPGLMDTFLNVPKVQVPERVCDVYSSAFTDLIKERIYLAVVVQEMVKPLVSGITFTGDFNEFKPIVHYVEGTGDGLVGGNTTPKHLKDLVKNVLNTFGSDHFVDVMHKIHNLYGPSDVEWVIREHDFNIETALYIVQVRPIKSFDLFNEVKDDWKPEGYAHLLKGKPIGIKSWKKTSEVYTMTTMDPKAVSKIKKNSIVLTSVGGDTCHAALQARDNGSAALLVSKDELKLVSGYNNFIASPEGNLYATNDNLNINLPKVKEVKLNNFRIKDASWTPIPLSDTDRRIFYYENIFLYFYNKINNPNYDGYDVAKIIGTYAYFACTGEMRHIKNHYIKDWLNLFGADSDAFDYSNRSYVINRIDPKLYLTSDKVIQITEAMIQYFDTPGAFPGGYGGKKWGRIAKLLLKFFTGKISCIKFVDKCLQIQHNSGSLFNKFNFFSALHIEINKLLDARQKSYNELVNLILKTKNTQYSKDFVLVDNINNIVPLSNTIVINTVDGDMRIVETLKLLEKPVGMNQKKKIKKCQIIEHSNGMTTVTG